MFRFVVALLAAFGLGALIFGGNAASAAGLVLLAPLFFIFKVMLFFMLFGVISSAMWRRGGGPRRSHWHRYSGYRGWERSDSDEDAPSRNRGDTDRFEEWHRMAHAKEEVDSWTPDEV